MDRNPTSNLEAIAAMPGLEHLADAAAPFVPPRKQAELVPTLMFLAARAAFKSANACQSALKATDAWERMQVSAARVGRMLPLAPPTFNKLHHLRRDADDGMAAALAAALPAVAVPLAQETGMLTPGPARWDRPDPGRVIYGDGSVFRPLSDVSVDDEGTVHGSRAKHKPRVAPRFEGKDGRAAGTGLPITIAGVHGRHRWQRIILGVELFQDRNEIGAAMRLFSDVIDRAQGGVSLTVYDRLMRGTHMRELMLAGVLPFVAMPEGAENKPHLVLPAELRRNGYRCVGTKEKRQGNGARRRPGDDAVPKARLAVHHLGTERHDAYPGSCAHDLYAVDAAVVAVPAGRDVDLDAHFVDCRSIRWEHCEDGAHPIGRFVVPCPHGAFDVEIDFAATRKGKSGSRPLTANWVRPIPEAATGSSYIEGLRSDSESVFSWMKALLPRQRASSLDPNGFLLDVIGAALLCNAIAWDVHAAQHTACAQHEAELARRRQLHGVA